MTDEDVQRSEDSAQKVLTPGEIVPPVEFAGSQKKPESSPHLIIQVRGSQVTIQESGVWQANATAPCPACKREIEGQPETCSHCHAKLSWIEGFPCMPGTEGELQERLAAIRKATKGLPNLCPNCGRFRPGIHPSSHDSVEYARAWARAVKKHDVCVKCCHQRRADRRFAAKKRREFLNSVLQLLVKLVIGLVATAILYKFIERLNQMPAE